MIGGNQGDCSDPTSDCYKAENLIDKYVDNELDQNESVFIDEHLADCPGCYHGFKFESNFTTRVKSLGAIAMPLEVRENIMLALGFPGMSQPINGSMSALGIDHTQEGVVGVSPENMGIPRGSIPRGDIPSNDFFDSSHDTNPDEG